MKQGLLVVGIVFALAMGITFGIRASADALAIVIGVVLGAVASIPTTILVAYILVRSRYAPDRMPPVAPQPPVVVISPPAVAPPVYPSATPLPGLPPPASKRTFTIIGDESTE